VMLVVVERHKQTAEIMVSNRDLTCLLLIIGIAFGVLLTLGRTIRQTKCSISPGPKYNLLQCRNSYPD
jgi:hypothetical protein